MPLSDPDKEKALLEEKIRVHSQIAFASGVFQADITIRTVLESLAEGVVIINATGTILLMNSCAEQMFGYQKEELIGKLHSILIPKRFRAVHEEHQAHFFAAPKIRPMGQLLNLAGQRRDGSEFPLEISLSFLETINGILVLAFISDITLRKELEKGLQKGEEWFHIMIECVRDYAIYLMDSQGYILNWNVGAERLKGYQAEEVIGKHFSCFYSEKDRSDGKPEADLKKATAKGQFAEESWRIRKDGSGFWADVVITALRDESGTLWGFSKVTHDITERKKAEDALRFSAARYRILFEDNPTMIFTLDTDWKILAANSSAISQLGYSREELEGQSVLTLFCEEDRAAVVDQFLKCLKSPSDVHHWQFRKTCKDGKSLWVEETAQATFDITGTSNILVVCQDVTDRKRAEDERERLLLQLEAVLENVNEGVVIADHRGSVIKMNEAALTIYGYQRDDVHICRPLTEYQDTFELYDLEGHSVPFEQWPLVRALRGERFVDSELRVLRKDTGKSWIASYNGSQGRGKSDDVMLSVVSVRDITERKKAEEALRESEQRFASFMLHLPAAAWIKDLQGRYVYANPEAERIFSRQFSELYGRTDKEIFSSETARQFHENDERVLQEDGHLQTVEVLQQADTIEHHSIVDKFSIPAFSGETAYIGGIAVDITDLQKAKAEIARLNAELEQRVAERTAELHESEMRFRALVTAGSNVVYRMSPDWNEMWQLRGQNFIADTEEPSRNWLQTYIHPDDQSQVKEVIDEAIRTKSILELEHRVLRVDGTLGWTLSRAIPLFDAEGEIIEWFGAASDITERKQAEDALKNLNLELERRVAERTEELEAANKDLEAFNYTVAHDLRQPLNVVNSFCQGIKMLCGDQLTTECKEFVQGAHNGTLRMNRLIDALLNFSRLARVELRPERVDLSSMAHEVAKDLKQAEPGRQVDFRIADGVVAYGDANLLRAVLDNLLGNAWKYTGKRDKAAIEFDVTDIDGRHVYFVRDNGAGFDMAEAEGLFTPFKRLPSAEAQRGFGIGLATVERVIQRHGGKVWAEGEPDKGACFFFTLPADTASK